MKTIDVAIKEANRIVNNQIRLAVKQKQAASSFWHKMRIIPVYKWIQCQKRQPGKELGFIPEQYSESIRFWDECSEVVYAQRVKWHSEWFAYMREKKDPGLGTKLCERCVSYPRGLSPGPGMYDKGTQRILIENLIEKKAGVNLQPTVGDSIKNTINEMLKNNENN